MASFDCGSINLGDRIFEGGRRPVPATDGVMQFVLGVPGTRVPATVAMVEHLRSVSPGDAPRSVCAIGPAQLPLNAYCILAGGHVRTGLEDNLMYRAGEQATNEQLVSRVVRLAGELQRPVATPVQARELLGVSG